MKQLKCIVVGLGRIGSTLEKDRLREKPCTHTGAIIHNRNCILAGGCDINQNKLRVFSRTWKCGNVTIDLQQLLQITKPDIIHIATPADTHLDIIRRAIIFNPKLIICEKPLALKKEDGNNILKLAQINKTKILVNHERRYSRDYIQVKNHIKKQTFGRFLSLSATVYMGSNSPAGDILLHDGTHMIDIIQFITEAKLKKIQAHKSQRYIYILAAAGTIPVQIEVGSGRNYIQFEMDINFSRGRIRIGNGLYAEYKSRKSPFYENMKSALKTDAARPPITGYFTNMMNDAVKCAKDPETKPVSSVEDGYSALEFIDNILNQS